MAKAYQITTPSFKGGISTGLNIIFIAEGYRSTDESLFYKDMMAVINRLSLLFPFSQLQNTESTKIACFYNFTPSANFSYATTTTGISGRTVFESHYISGVVGVNKTKVNQFIDALTHDDLNTGNPVNINALVPKGMTTDVSGVSVIDCNTLIVILLPVASLQNIELEINDINIYYSIVTSADVLAEQVILRAICKLQGLADEFDLAGATYLQPTAEQGNDVNIFFPNLVYLPNLTSGPNPATDATFKWRGLFNATANYAIPVHPNSTPNIPNRNLPATNVTYETIELWEGGGNYRKKVYRTAEDCLLRRRIGDTSLPIKAHLISLCPACREKLMLSIKP